MHEHVYSKAVKLEENKIMKIGIEALLVNFKSEKRKKEIEVKGKYFLTYTQTHVRT